MLEMVGRMAELSIKVEYITCRPYQKRSIYIYSLSLYVPKAVGIEMFTVA